MGRQIDTNREFSSRCVSDSARLSREKGVSSVLATLNKAFACKENTMSKVSMMGTITCQDGKADEMEVVLTSMVEAAREEPGVEIYSYHRGEGNSFSFFALMTNQEAMQGHGKSEAMQAAMQSFMPLMAEPPQMAPATPIAAFGFDI